MTIMASQAREYGQGRDMRMVMAAWQILLGDYPARTVMAAIANHFAVSPYFPTAADLKKIIEPDPVLITESEYRRALIEHQNNGYATWSNAYQTVKSYEEQQNKRRERQKTDVALLTQHKDG